MRAAILTVLAVVALSFCGFADEPSVVNDSTTDNSSDVISNFQTGEAPAQAGVTEDEKGSIQFWSPTGILVGTLSVGTDGGLHFDGSADASAQKFITAVIREYHVKCNDLKFQKNQSS